MCGGLRLAPTLPLLPGPPPVFNPPGQQASLQAGLTPGLAIPIFRVWGGWRNAPSPGLRVDRSSSNPPDVRRGPGAFSGELHSMGLMPTVCG